MKPNTMVYLVLLFGIIVSVVSPRIISMAITPASVYESTEDVKATNTSVSTALNTGDTAASTSSMDVAMVTSGELAKTEEVTTTVVEEKEETKTVEEPAVVYDGLTMEQLVAKLNKNLNSTLSNTGNLFASYSLNNGVDPYLAVAIALHETGCKWSCSGAVKNNNNVGGMYSSGSLMSFSSLEEGISAFIKNLKTRFIDKGMTTADQMSGKYASSPTWASKVNNYISIIKNS